MAEEAVAHTDHLPLLLRQAPPHRAAQEHGVLPGVELLQQVLLPRHHILDRQGPAIGPRLDQIGQRHVLTALAPAAKIHQNLIFNAPRRIGRQLDVLIHPVGADGFDEPDGPDGDQILLVRFAGVVFFHDMRHQTQVPLDEDVPGFDVALGGAL